MKAIGYISVGTDDEEAITAEQDRITSFCAEERYELLEIYVERNAGDDDRQRDALTVLLDHVGLAEGVVVIVPSFDHLSATPSVRMAFTASIEQMGGHVQALVTSPTRR